MRIIVNIKQHGSNITLEPRLDGGSKDTPAEREAGERLFQHIGKAFSDLEAAQHPPERKPSIWRRIANRLRGRK